MQTLFDPYDSLNWRAYRGFLLSEDLLSIRKFFARKCAKDLFTLIFVPVIRLAVDTNRHTQAAF